MAGVKQHFVKLKFFLRRSLGPPSPTLLSLSCSRVYLSRQRRLIRRSRPCAGGMAQPVRRVEVRRVGFVYSAGWGGGEAAIIGMLNGRDICIVFTTLRETNEGNGGPLAR